MAWLYEYKSKKTGKIKRIIRWREGGRGSPIKNRKAGEIKKTAKDIKEKVEDNLARHGTDIKSPNATIREIYKEYIDTIETEILREEKKEATLDHVKDHLKFYLEKYGNHKACDYNEGHVFDYQKLLRKETRTMKSGKVRVRFSTNGVRIKMIAVKAFLNWATEEKYFYVNPCKSLKIDDPVEVARPLNDDEIYQVLDIGCQFNPQLREVLETFFYTGLRLGVAAKLSKEQVMDGLIYIAPRRAKSKKPTTVPILPPIQPYFDRVKSGPIFPGWTANRIRQALRRAVKRAGIKGRVRVHDLRHSCATFLLRKGYATLEDVQKLLGHTRSSTTEIYSHFDRNYLKEKLKNVRFPGPQKAAEFENGAQ